MHWLGQVRMQLQQLGLQRLKKVVYLHPVLRQWFCKKSSRLCDVTKHSTHVLKGDKDTE